MSISARQEAVTLLSSCHFPPSSTTRSVRFPLDSDSVMYIVLVNDGSRSIYTGVDPMPIAPQYSTVESIRIRISPKTYCTSMSIGFCSGFRKVGEGFKCSSLRYVVIPFVSLFNGLYCCIVIFIHGTGVCFPCIHSFSFNDGFSSGIFVYGSVIAGSAPQSP